MQLSNRMMRLSRKDIEDLSAASVKLSEVAATIQGTKANYVPACTQLLREANDIVVAIRDRALATLQRVLARLDDRADAAAAAEATSSPAAPAGWPSAEPGAKE